MGATRFGNPGQRRKVCLILDRDRYRFQKFISDIAGQDIAAHKDDPQEAIKALRKWLSTISTRVTLPGGTAIVRRYKVFQDELPEILAKLDLEAEEVTFADYTNIVEEWLVGHPRAAN